MNGRSIQAEEVTSLSGMTLAITGRLASMTRDQAITLIRTSGGHYVEEPDGETHWLIVGSEGWPLRSDGRPTRSLERARQLERAGHAIHVASEVEFLQAAGHADRGADLSRLYTTEQLSRILDVPVRVIRGWIRKKLIRPRRVVRRLCWFDFQQVASAKALQQLLDAGVTGAQIRSSLLQLQSRLPSAQLSLTQLEALEHRGPLIVRLDSGVLTEPSGQLRFPFADETEADESPPPTVRRDVFDPGQRSAADWFLAGVDAEDDGQLEEAAEAYQFALLSGGPQPEISFNLGNVLQALGRAAESTQRYLVAIELDPEYIEAWNNLGNALSELRRSDEAISAYRRALAIEPSYIDAHFNLAETLHAANRLTEARPHWERYLASVPNETESAYVRRKIRECLSPRR